MDDKTIPRQMISVSLSLSDGRSLAGEMQIDLDARMSDFMNGENRFVVLRDRDGAYRLINKDHIIDMNLQ